MTNKTAVEVILQSMFDSGLDDPTEQDAQAALDALKAEGFCVVPVEPSGAQVGDMTKVMRDNGLFNDNYRIARAIYAAAQGGE